MRGRASQPIVFGPEERPLFGMLHPARGPTVRSVGVVLCNPLGHEALCTHRTYRHLAEKLAERGIPALRFDYDGTGDSFGLATDPARLAAWIASARAAIDELRARSGAAKVSLFGVRFGAVIAALAARAREDVESLIAWAPPRSGQAYVREMRAMKMIRDPLVERRARPDGAEEVIGYLFSRETLAEMEQVDLASLAAPPRALILSRLPKPVDEAPLIAALESRGSQVRVLTDTGYAKMMRDPYLSEPPAAALEAMVEWVAEAPAQAAPAPAKAGSRRVLESAGLRETPVVFGEGDRLFGVLSEPTVPGKRDRPVVCLLSVGADHHIGPNRMYVDFARELAAAGYSSFRFDIGGLGDSAPAEGRPENKLYDIRTVDDVITALDLLAARPGDNRFVLAGLCSGAFLAYQAAIRDPRVVGQVLINTFAFEWKEGDPIEPGKVIARYGSAGHYARALLDKGVWARVFKGDIDWRTVGAFASNYALQRTGALLTNLGARLRGEVNPVEKAFNALCDRGVESLLISGFGDMGLDMIARHLGDEGARMRGRNNFALEVVEKVDHTFTPVVTRAKLAERFIHYMQTLFPGLRED